VIDPQIAAYDVIVAGGGAGGVGAAVGAAQSGARVALIERAPFLGGAATLSNVLTYCGYWTQADPPRECVGGVGADVLRTIGRYDGYEGPVRMSSSNVVVALLDPEAVKIALDRVCEEAGVDVLLHAMIVDAHSEGELVKSVRVHDHSGARTLHAPAFVDASGEADLATYAGVATHYGGPDGRVQNGTLAIRFGGIERTADVHRAIWQRAIRDGKARGLRELTKEHGLVVRLPGSNDVIAFLADEAFDARDARSLSVAERSARKQAWAYLEAIRALPGHEHAYIVSTGPSIGTRESRHVVARTQLQAVDIEAGLIPGDTIALGGWPVEYHGGPGEPNVWRRIRNNGAYGIGFEVICSASHTNIFSAGRTIDADAYAFASARVMGTAFATGHAAGIAAAQRARDGTVNAERVRAELIKQGALIDAPRSERTLSA